MADATAEVAHEGSEAAVVVHEAFEAIRVDDLTVHLVILTTAANGPEVAAVGFQNT